MRIKRRDYMNKHLAVKKPGAYIASAVLVTAVLLFFISGCAQTADTPQELCEQQGGEWRTFSNACADSCAYNRGEVDVCAQVLTDSCDCGEGRCWNGAQCVDV